MGVRVRREWAVRWIALGCLGLTGGVTMGACSSPEGSGQTVAAQAETAQSSTAKPQGEDLPTRQKEEELKPLYPMDTSPPNPTALAFCEALHDLESQRRAQCCSAPVSSGAFTKECARTLSAAVKLGAIELDTAQVNLCVSAMQKKMEGCGWVGPRSVDLPSECLAVTKGLVGERKVCRSSLECADGYTCQGLSTTQVGKCLKPKPDGAICGGSVDTLAALTRQNVAAEERHPECAGHCLRPVCMGDVGVGGECKTGGECAAGLTCQKGKCTQEALPGEGKACAAGECSDGLRCVKERCIQPKEDGQVCDHDAECRSACVKSEGQVKGACGQRCAATTIPKHAAFTPKGKPVAR
ncbi:MAG: hypothetical protein IPK82_09890 [Polyangiaceae bacterium]|nr:hypothetical protein [Polyangiaceae bacterium]